MELKAKLDTAQEKISEHEDKAKEIIQKKAENKKEKKFSVNCGTILSSLTYF